MKQEYIIRIVAGLVVLAGTSLAYFVDITWLLLPVFVAVNLIQSAFTKFYPLEYFLDKMNVKRK